MGDIGSDLFRLGADLSVSRKWDLQRSFTWRLLMLETFNGVLGDYVSQYCQDIIFGDYSMSELSIQKYGAFQRFYAGIQSIDVVDLTFLIPTDNSVQAYFYGWYDRIVDTKGFYSPKSFYRKDVYFLLSDQTGSMTSAYRFRGMFPKTHPKVHPSYESDDVLKATVSLSVDSIELTSLTGVLHKKAVGSLGNVVNPDKVENSILGRK